MKEQIKTFLDSLKHRQDKVRIAVILGAAGMLMILLSELLPDKENNITLSSGDSIAETDETESFRKSTEAQLKELLEQIDGVGNCEVMLTVEGTTEYVYAENISRYTDTAPDRQSDKADTDIVIVEQNGDKQALIKKVIRPRISGVMIVCDGGGDISVNERVLRAVSTALNISSGRVCVENKRKVY